MTEPSRHAAEEAKGWLYREARSLRAPLAYSTLCAVVETLTTAAQAWLLAGILAAALFQRASLAMLWPAWLGLLALAPVRWWLGQRGRSIADGAALGLVTRLRRRLLAEAEAIGPLGLRELASGDVITRIVDGVDALLPYFSRYLPQVAAAVVTPLLLALCVFPADWISGLVLVLTVPLIPVFMVLVGGAAERASRDRFAELTRLGAAFMDALGGLVVLRQLGAAERVAERLGRDGERYRGVTLQVLRIAFLSALVLEFFASVSIAIVAVLIGFRLLWHDIAFRNGLFILLLAPEFYLPLRALGALRHARMDALAAAGQLQALADLPRSGARGGHRPPPRAAPAIRLDAVRLSHEGRGGGLCNCSLELVPGRVTALVGASGAGKSSLMDLLLGFAAPTAGRIRVDRTDLCDLDLAAWRGRIAWLPQQPHVFEGSVRRNLRLARADATVAELARAAQLVGLDAVVAGLPHGWHTHLGENGVGLSGGELQRLALARVWLRRDAQVLLLDEPTAHLDDASAAAIERTIRAWGRTRTVLMAVHRLASTSAADQVAVLDGGRIVELGPPRELALRGGAFARLLRAEAA